METFTLHGNQSTLYFKVCRVSNRCTISLRLTPFYRPEIIKKQIPLSESRKIWKDLHNNQWLTAKEIHQSQQVEEQHWVDHPIKY